MSRTDQNAYCLLTTWMQVYYKDVLTKDQQQLSQAFITTHSEYVIKDAYEAKDLIIILKRNENGKIEAISSLKLDLFPSSPTYNEIKYSAFDLITPDFHSELFDFLQKSRSTPQR